MTVFPHYSAKAAQFLNGIMAGCQCSTTLKLTLLNHGDSRFDEAGVDWNLKYW